MSTLIFDIETIGEDFDAMDGITQKVLTDWIRNESGSETEYDSLFEGMKERLGFSPLTGEIVAIGVMDREKEKGVVYYQAPGSKEKETEDDAFSFKPMTEKEMLQSFWEGAAKYDEFVSFNGRRFDVPFLMVRSAIHGIKPTKNLMANRYLNIQPNNAKHVDLLDQLTFYGASMKRGNLHLWSRAFGIKSPKTEEASGNEVGKWFSDGRYLDIARYNVDDLKATKELYDYWEKYLRF